MPNIDFGYRFCPRCGGATRLEGPQGVEPQRLVCRGCDFVFYLGSPRWRACTICMVDGGIVLLKRTIEPRIGTWVFPGGFVDRGEAVSAAAIRETLEESHLRASSLTGILGRLLVSRRRGRRGRLRGGGRRGHAHRRGRVRRSARLSPEQIPWGELAFESTRGRPSRLRAPVLPAGARPALTVDAGAQFSRARTPRRHWARTEEAVALLDRSAGVGPRASMAVSSSAPSLHAGGARVGEALVLNEQCGEAVAAVGGALNALARRLHARGRDQEALKTAHGRAPSSGRGQLHPDRRRLPHARVVPARDARRYREAIAVAEEGSRGCPTPVLAQWATQIEEELIAAERRSADRALPLPPRRVSCASATWTAWATSTTPSTSRTSSPPASRIGCTRQADGAGRAGHDPRPRRDRLPLAPGLRRVGRDLRRRHLARPVVVRAGVRACTSGRAARLVAGSRKVLVYYDYAAAEVRAHPDGLRALILAQDPEARPA